MWIFLFMILIMPFEKSPHLLLTRDFFGLPNFTFIKLVGIAGLGWTLVEVLTKKIRLGLFDSSQSKAFFLYLAAVVLSSIANGAGITLVFRLLAILLLLPLLLAAVRTENHIRLALVTAAGILVVILPYAYRQTLRFGGRLGVGLNEPNYYALALVLLLPLPFVFSRIETGPWKRRFWMMGVGSLVLQLVLTGSRGAFLGLLVVAPYLCFRLMKRPVVTLAAGGALLLALLMVVPNPMRDRLLASGIDSSVRDTGVRVSNERRMEVLEAGIRIFQRNMWAGIGIGNFKPMMAQEIDRGSIAHNTYIEVAAELGIPGLLAFLWMIACVFRSLWRSQRFARRTGNRRLREMAVGMEVGLAGYLVTAIFLSAGYEKFFWLIIFLSIVTERVARREYKEALARRKAAEAPKAPPPTPPRDMEPAWA
jgi:O-antigen ligase